MSHIPDIWAKRMLESQVGASFWNRFGPLPERPPLSRWQRVRSKVRRFIDRDRERLALLIAPWLAPQDWYE